MQTEQPDHNHILIFYFPIQYSQSLFLVLLKLFFFFQTKSKTDISQHEKLHKHKTLKE